MIETFSEKTHVNDVYDAIATDFSRTRTRVWNHVQKFLDDIPNDSKCIDIGCGNGKNMLHDNINQRVNFVGIDNCKNFVKICKDRSLTVECMDCCDLQYQDNTFDYALSIAVIHHMNSYERRMKAVSEMIRILKKEGIGLVSFWSFENQDKHMFDVGDNMVKWKHSITNVVYDRFYYIFDEHDLKEFMNVVIDKFGIKVLEMFNEKGNWYITFKKV